MEYPKGPTIGFWCSVIASLLVLYFGAYAAVRSVGLLSLHMIGGEGGMYVWVSGPIISGGGDRSGRFKENAELFLEIAFRPLCRGEGQFWTGKYSGEDEELLRMPLPAR